jgi:hypothetical protein
MAIAEFIQTKTRAFVRAQQELGLGGAFYVTLRYFWRLYKTG